jgi:XTP/dITP diphosphohydrolase
LPAEFLLATRSRDKAAEIVAVLQSAATARFSTLAELALPATPAEDDVEQFQTFIDNAIAKAAYFAGVTGRATMADDSGLMVDALDGGPGVRTKRFAADHGYHGNDTDAANNRLLLERLDNVPEAQRGARYVCAAALAWPPA